MVLFAAFSLLNFSSTASPQGNRVIFEDKSEIHIKTTYDGVNQKPILRMIVKPLLIFFLIHNIFSNKDINYFHMAFGSLLMDIFCR